MIPGACRRRNVDQRRSPLGRPGGREGSYFVQCAARPECRALQKVIRDPLLAPRRLLGPQASDHSLKYLRTSGSTWPRLYSPEPSPGSPVPPDHRVRPCHHWGLAPTEPSREHRSIRCRLMPGSTYRASGRRRNRFQLCMTASSVPIDSTRERHHRSVGSDL